MSLVLIIHWDRIFNTIYKQVRSQFLDILWSIILTPEEIKIDWKNPQSILNRTDFNMSLESILNLYCDRICNYFELSGESFVVSTALCEKIEFTFLTPKMMYLELNGIVSQSKRNKKRYQKNKDANQSKRNRVVID